jgi:hypothetical protein
MRAACVWATDRAFRISTIRRAPRAFTRTRLPKRRAERLTRSGSMSSRSPPAGPLLYNIVLWEKLKSDGIAELNKTQDKILESSEARDLLTIFEETLAPAAAAQRHLRQHDCAAPTLTRFFLQDAKRFATSTKSGMVLLFPFPEQQRGSKAHKLNHALVAGMVPAAP